jgi:hypothetical protein
VYNSAGALMRVNFLKIFPAARLPLAKTSAAITSASAGAAGPLASDGAGNS